MSNMPSIERDNGHGHGHGLADERTRLINSENGQSGMTLDAQVISLDAQDMDLRAPAAAPAPAATPWNADNRSGYQSQLAENSHRNVEER